MTLSNPAQYISGRTVQEQMNSLIDYVDQRAADVALDAIASDVAQVHQDMLDADADATAAAASAAAAASTLANAVKKTGEASQSIEGDVSLSTGDLSVAGDAGVQGQLSVIGGCDLRAPVKIPMTPTNNDDAASKKYVDDSLDNYAPMLRTTGNQIKDGSLQLNNIGKGTVALATNLNINARAVKLGRASGYGVYRYGGAFFIVMCRDQLYLIRLTSGSGAVLHNATVTNLASVTVVADPTTLPFTLGYYIDSNDSNIYVVIKGTSGNKLATVYWMGGSQGGTTGLAVFPTINDEVTETVTYFWEV